MPFARSTSTAPLAGAHRAGRPVSAAAPSSRFPAPFARFPLPASRFPSLSSNRRRRHAAPRGGRATTLGTKGGLR
jgi:hypothetical protein